MFTLIDNTNNGLCSSENLNGWVVRTVGRKDNYTFMVKKIEDKYTLVNMIPESYEFWHNKYDNTETLIKDLTYVFKSFSLISPEEYKLTLELL